MPTIANPEGHENGGTTRRSVFSPDEHRLTEVDLREMSLRLAHTIRNPLSTIKSSAQLIQRLQLSPEEAADYLDGVIREVSRIDRTVREMEEFVRIEPGKGPPAIVAEAVGDAVSGISSSCPDRSFEARIEGDRNLCVMMDRQSLANALVELLENTIHHAPDAGPVVVTWYQRNGVVRIDVLDRGPGVPESMADRILRPFFSTSKGGVGLGLNRVDRTARFLGGRLTWENRSSGGCRFSLLLEEA